MTARAQPTRRELEARLDDWAGYVRDQHGDLTPREWAQIDQLLDQYTAAPRAVPEHSGRSGTAPYAPAGDPEFRPAN